MLSEEFRGLPAGKALRSSETAPALGLKRCCLPERMVEVPPRLGLGSENPVWMDCYVNVDFVRNYEIGTPDPHPIKTSSPPSGAASKG